MEITYHGNVVFNIDIENQIKFAHLIQEKIANKIPLNEIDMAFKEAQLQEDREEKNETYRR